MLVLFGDVLYPDFLNEMIKKIPLNKSVSSELLVEKKRKKKICFSVAMFRKK